MSRKEKEANFWMKFVVNDWLADPHLSACSPATRGIWMDVICNLHNMRQPKFSASDAAWARMCRCSPSEIQIAFYELQVSGTATVVEEQGVFTVTSRRMEREMEISGVRRAAVSSRADRQATNEQQSSYKTDTNEPTKCVQNPNSNSSFNSSSQGEVQEREAEHPISGEMVAQSVLFELRISGRDLRNVLDDVCRAEIKHGEVPGLIRDRMVRAWQDYTAPQTVAQLEYTTGAAKFFGEGRWKDRNTWPWKAGVSNGSNQGNRTKAQQRSANSDAAILDAWSDLAGAAGVGEAGIADEGELSNAGGDGGDGGAVAGGLDGARHQARHVSPGGRPQATPRVIEIPAVPSGHRGTHHAGAGGEAYAARC
jgi:hypothetical protein